MTRVIASTTNSGNRTGNRKFTAKPTGTIPKSVFTPNDIVQLLQAIDELKGLEIFHETLEDGSIEFTIGDNVYGGIN